MIQFSCSLKLYIVSISFDRSPPCFIENNRIISTLFFLETAICKAKVFTIWVNGMTKD
jgi:hypothetical protein